MSGFFENEASSEALLNSETIFTAAIKVLSANSVLCSNYYSFFSFSLSSISGSFQVKRNLSPSFLLADPVHLSAHI
jgi:hypothetical protein